MGSSAGDPAAYSNTVRIGYARVSGRTQDHQLQLDALAAADCRGIVIETASTRTDRPKLRQALAVLGRWLVSQRAGREGAYRANRHGGGLGVASFLLRRSPP